jgi:hypothetical protein
VLSNGELRGVNADRESACASLDVIPREGTLSLWIELALAIKGEWVRRNDNAISKALKYVWRNLRAMH